MFYNEQNFFASSITIAQFKQMIAEVLKEQLTNIIEHQKECIQEGNRKDAEKPMSIDEVAKHFNVTRVTIHNWRKRGLIQGVKVGRKRFFQKTEIIETLTKHGYSSVNRKA